MSETKRSVSLEAEEILGKRFKVLDHGFVSLVDYMGTDVDIEAAARVSYGGGTRKTSETEGLIRYMRRHRHCYSPEMEVLTCRGWVRWDKCNSEETFLIPNPADRSLHKERLSIEAFEVEDEKMVCFSNSRLSFKVTADHRMWFKKKFQGLTGTDGEKFEIVKASEMSKWGHFDSSSGYTLHPLNGTKDPEFQFIGFYLGDGSYTSTNRISFHIKKERKKIYLRSLLTKLGLSYRETPSSTYEDALVFFVETPAFLRINLGERLSSRAFHKGFPLGRLKDLKGDKIRGLWDGLVQSDGSRKSDRSQITYSSVSKSLIILFETTSAMLGLPVKIIWEGIGANAMTGRANEIESRKEFFSTESLTGKVYCTTSSTGLLMVRGGPGKYGFVCGNSSPSEMVELKFHCAMPIFVARQWIRHRTANVSEISGRYSILPTDFYTPQPEQLTTQATNNKQGRSDTQLPSSVLNEAYGRWDKCREASASTYEWMTANDIARELARIDLPLSTYTQWYWKIDLHNLLHFLTLRIDKHAQWEIQQYGKVMAGMLKRVAPLSYKAWIDYDVCGVKLSRMEMNVIKRLIVRYGDLIGINDYYDDFNESALGERDLTKFGLSKRECSEFLDLLPDVIECEAKDPNYSTFSSSIGEIPDFELDLSKEIK